MIRPRNNIAIGFTIFIGICLLGGCLYFVGGISATTPPIRQYKFNGSAKKFRNGLDNLIKSDTTFKYKDEDKTGDEKIGYAYYLTVNHCEKRSCNEYHLKYEGEKSGTRISLIAAFDEGYKHGGYGLKAVGIKPLLNKFEADILNPLKMSQKINLVRDTSFWSNFSIY